MAQAATFVLQSERCISSKQSKELIDYLETLRLPEKTAKPEEVKPQVEEKAEDDNSSSPTDRLNDPSIYGPQVPYLIYDENKETILSRTAKGINEGKLNPYEVNWMEVTLYESMFVKPLLESVDSAYLMDVAQAIDDEEGRRAREDGQYTIVSSDSYGTGQGLAFYYSHTIDNWDNDVSAVSAVSIAEGIIDKRKKADAYRKKLNSKIVNQISESKKHIVEIIDEPESHLHVNMKESIIDQCVEDEINALKKECEEWKKKYEEAITKEPEKAFNATGKECFSKSKMGLLIYTIASITDGPIPVKKNLVPIISSIGGWESTSVESEIKKAGFSQKNIDEVAEVFKKAMPNLASKIKQQTVRPKGKK